MIFKCEHVEVKESVFYIRITYQRISAINFALSDVFLNVKMFLSLNAERTG